MIRLRDVRKSYGDVEAVRGISVDVQAGESFGFLGPNGAGKSSTMKMLGAVSPPSGGELSILGMDPATDGPAIRARLGVCPQDDTLDNELNVRDNLVVYGRYFGLQRAEVAVRADELLRFVQLTEKAKSKVEDLSGGMKRRLTVARSLINQPDVLLLDEPTTGLDPQARHLLWDRLFRLKQQGVTLVLTTHYMDEAEQLCDRLVVMDGGLIVAEGSPLDLIRQHSTREVAELRFAVGEHESIAAKVEDIADRVEVLPDRLLLYTHDGEETLAKVHERGIDPVAVLVRRSTLEDVFLRLTGRTLVDDGHLRQHCVDRALGDGLAPVRLLGDRLPAHLEGHGDHLVPDAVPVRRSDGCPARRVHRPWLAGSRGRRVVPCLRGSRSRGGACDADRDR